MEFRPAFTFSIPFSLLPPNPPPAYKTYISRADISCFLINYQKSNPLSVLFFRLFLNLRSELRSISFFHLSIYGPTYAYKSSLNYYVNHFNIILYLFHLILSRIIPFSVLNFFHRFLFHIILFLCFDSQLVSDLPLFIGCSPFESIIHDWQTCLCVLILRKTSTMSRVIISSWDNLSSKGSFPFLPDHIMVWGKADFTYAVSTFNIPPSRLSLLTPFKYYRYINPTISPQAKLSQSQIRILFCGTTSFSLSDERYYFHTLNKYLSESGLDFSIVYKPHPRTSHTNSILQDPAKNMEYLQSLALESDILISYYSTVQLDFLLQGKLVINARCDDLFLFPTYSELPSSTHISFIRPSPLFYETSSVSETVSLILSLSLNQIFTSSQGIPCPWALNIIS